ncbi:MAG: hypothetical protein ABIR11_02285 [Candidatus Limnocylindrales bacterium]
MHGTTRTRPSAVATRTGVNAVVWIEPGRALLARGAVGEEPTVIETPIPHTPTATLPALATVARQVGEVDRVLILGTDELRTALEREIVAIGHRPETIREAALEGPVDRDLLVARLSRLT